MGEVATATTSTCAKCGAALESVSSPDVGCMVCMLQLASAKSQTAFDRDSPLEQFGQYVIEKREDGRAWELGRGAMGVTYRATDSIARLMRQPRASVSCARRARRPLCAIRISRPSTNSESTKRAANAFTRWN